MSFVGLNCTADQGLAGVERLWIPSREECWAWSGVAAGVGRGNEISSRVAPARTGVPGAEKSGQVAPRAIQPAATAPARMRPLVSKRFTPDSARWELGWVNLDTTRHRSLDPRGHDDQDGVISQVRRM
jgi:hypothetical protein